MSDELAIIETSKAAIVEQGQYSWAVAVSLVCHDFIDATAVNINGKRYIPVEGWQSIAAAWGCTPSTEEPYQVEGGYRCKAQLKRDSDGAIISEAFAFVEADEIGKDRARYANEAMVQTRAISRVCRNKFAFVAAMMKIKDLSTTPAEEVPRDGFPDASKAKHYLLAETSMPMPVKLRGIVENAKEKQGKDKKTGEMDGTTIYEATVEARYLWTKNGAVGKELIAANGLDAELSLKPGSKPNIYQVLDVRIPDEIQ